MVNSQIRPNRVNDGNVLAAMAQMPREAFLPKALHGVAYVDELEMAGRTVRMQRFSDNFLETLEMDLPGLVTVTTERYAPRYVPLGGLQRVERVARREHRVARARERLASPRLRGQRVPSAQLPRARLYQPPHGLLLPRPERAAAHRLRMRPRHAPAPDPAVPAGNDEESGMRTTQVFQKCKNPLKYRLKMK